MDGWLANLASIAWAQCWQLTALIAVVWMMVRFTARNRPHLASVLWLVVLLKCVTPPLWSSPSGVFCWLQWRDQANSRVNHSEQTPTYEPIDESSVVTVRASAISHPAPEAAITSPALVISPLPAEPPRGSLTGKLLLGSLLLWLSGSGAFVAVTVVRLQSCWWQLRRTDRVLDAELETLLEKLRVQLGVRHRVRLWITSSRVGPAVVGLWRPTVIVPTALVEGKWPEDVAPLLAHELIHIRRGDLWLGLLQTLAEGLWWFHPLVRGASRLLTREAERCCDEAVIAHLECTPAAYARSLLDVLALKQQLQPVPSFPGVRPVDVTRGRLERIMQLRQGCRRRTPWWCWLVLALAAAAALPGAALIVGAGERGRKNGEPVLARPMNARRISVQLDEPTPPLPTSNELVVRTYDLADLVEKFSEEVDERRPNARLVIAGFVKRSAPGPWKNNKFGIVNRAGMWENESAKYELGWVNDKLIVVHTLAGHQLIENQFNALRKHGFANHLVVEVRILSGPVIALDRIASHWKLIGATGEDKWGAEPEHAEEAAAFFPGNDESTTNIRGAVQSVIEKQVPAILALLDDYEASLVINAAQGDAKTNILQAPKVTVFNGQSARIEDTTQRPFVVGVKSSPGGGEQPQIRVISEGTVIRLRPELKGESRVLLDLGLTLSHLRGVETAELPNGRSYSSVRVQVPEVGITRMNSTVEMDLDQMLAIGLPAATSDKSSTPGCILVKVRKITENLNESGQSAQVSEKKNSETTVRAQDVAPPVNPPPLGIPLESKLIERVYPVADLVVGFPNQPAVISLDGTPLEEASRKVVGPDYESLIDLVTQTIVPPSWKQSGGPGTIEPLPNRLSVVVQQKPYIHSQIADLFEQLRSLQDVQIMWTADLLKLPPAAAESLAEGKLAEIASGKVQRAVLAPAEVRKLRAALDSKRDTSLPKYTLFNGQTLDFRFQRKSHEQSEVISRLQIQFNVTSDFRFLRVYSALDDEPLGKGAVDVGHGHSLLVDVAPQGTGKGNLPPERHLCLLTPRVLLRSRESAPEDARALSAHESE